MEESLTMEENIKTEGKARVNALRGAVCVSNDKAEIAEGVVELYDGLLATNGLAEEDLISLFFSITPDLDAINPAAALRQSGRAGKLAMMVFQEAVVQGGFSRTIRILLHCYPNQEKSVKHLYLRGAEKLRPDWAG